MAKYLLVVADDFGACKQIDDGILASVEKDNIDCVDVFVTFPAAANDIRALQAKLKAKGRKIGLHLTLTVGSPVATDHSAQFLKLALQEGSTFFRPITQHVISKAIDNGKPDSLEENMDGIEKEIKAQLKKFEEITGQKPDHVSCHEGFFHLTEKLTRKYLDIMHAEQLFVRNPSLISLTGPQAWLEETMMQKTAKHNASKVLAHNGLGALDMYEWSKKELAGVVKDYRQKGLRTTDYFVDTFFGNGRDHILKAILKRMESGSYEMVVHPVQYGNFNGFETPSGIDKESFKYRKTETETLTKPLFASRLTERSVERYPWS